MNLRDLRMRAGMTQNDLAYRMQVQQAAVSAWERGIRLPNAKNIAKLIKAFTKVGIETKYEDFRKD